MIRTVVVEDDYRVAELHRAYAERVAGFSVVGVARSGAEAMNLVRRARPDLLLLDIYLPDISGVELLRLLRAPGEPAVDVIAITAARDVETLRAAMHGGVLQYLVKPFRFSAFEQKMRSYAAMCESLARLGEADQREVDRLYGLLRTSGTEWLPKGLSSGTLALVLHALRQAHGTPSAEEVAQRAGISRVTARRYLDHLAQSGQVELTMRYGAPGRPEHRYRLMGTRSD